MKSLTSRISKRPLYSKNFNSELIVNFKQVNIAEEFLNDVKMSAKLEKGKIVNLNGFGAFSNTETAQIQIKKNNNTNLETTLTSDRSKPFLIGLNFAKDFSNGKLNFMSKKFNDNKSYSKITLSKYYVKKMPILANLLSLTSFTGIIDTLEGKGVFFDKSYLEYEVINKNLEIKEAYGTGDSLGYTLEGSINSDGFVSLSGNLVPAYMLNNIIRQIPVVGKVLTGKKGDGIFGASFKIKGHPDSLKTTVNPIRTLTPRFIQRFIELFRSPK
jgi:nucleoid DNA-binding protein